MRTLEYEGKQVFRRYGLPVPRGIPAVSPEEAGAAAREIGGEVVVKAQVHMGGRGKSSRRAVSISNSMKLCGELQRQLLLWPRGGNKVSILVSEETRVLVQGITGREGSYHTRLMQEYGTIVVAGTSPGKGGQMHNGVPVFNTVEAAVKEGIDASIIFVPAGYAMDAVYEAAASGIELIICITEGIPANDVMVGLRRLREFFPKARVIGPNCPGIISPGRSGVSIMPGQIFEPGSVGVVSRSGTLTYQIAFNMGQEGLGQSSVVGIGGDPFIGSNFIDIIKLFEADPETEAICVVGEIGGSDEEEAAAYIKENVSKPEVAYVAGRTAPPGKKMGHAGAIVSASSGTAASKIQAFKAAGVPVARAPYQIPSLLKAALPSKGPAGEKYTI